MAKLLIVDDDILLCKTIEALLKHENHSMDIVHNGLDAIDRIEYEYYDLIVLDWDLPDIQGPEICKKYRAAGGEKPVLFLTGKSSAPEKVLGLDSGADDYLAKPFDHMELSARVRALLRRKVSSSSIILNYKNLELDTTNDTVIINGEAKEFFPKEVAILKLLIKNPNTKFSTQTILERLWSSQSETSTESIKTYIAKLRKKLSKYNVSFEIKNTPKVGYFLEEDK